MTTKSTDAGRFPEDELPRETRVLEETERHEIAPRGRAQAQRIRELVDALGDPSHPEHATSLGDLVAIGPPAVGALSAALSPDRPWLAAYRAAEAIAQIGDGRASGALINALRHPNSNVRYSAVRALAEVGDTRTLWALRRVAHGDRGKTSWGDSVADTAQLALDRLQARSALLRFTEPIKTALVFVMTFAAVLFALGRVQAVIAELRKEAPAPAGVVSVSTTETPASEQTLADLNATPTPAVTPTTAAPPTSVITSTVKAGAGNVRSEPRLGDNVIGYVNRDDELIFLGVNGDWYLVELGSKVSERSSIRGGQGWVSRVVVNEPQGTLPEVKPTTTP